MSAPRQTLETDVLVIGGGPAGAATGFWLAQLGHQPIIVERKHFPREKTCGDGLTPRAVKQINDMGLAALALLVAESDPVQKETMIRLIMNMLALESRTQ